MSEPLPFEHHVLQELVNLRALVELALEASGVVYERRSEAPGVLSLAHAVAELVEPALEELSYRNLAQAAVPTVKHVLRDDNGEVTQIVEIPSNFRLNTPPAEEAGA